MSSQPAPTRTLPPKPSLAQLRKQAKELFHSYRAGREAAVAEIERFERSPDPATFALADAQRVLARAYGFASWAELKHRVESVNFQALLAAAEARNAAAVRRLRKTHFERFDAHLVQLRDSALRRAVLDRNQELTRVLMHLGADARVGIWPHRDVTPPLMPLPSIASTARLSPSSSAGRNSATRGPMTSGRPPAPRSIRCGVQSPKAAPLTPSP